jgi:3-dehydroquinate dehydratase-1
MTSIGACTLGARPRVAVAIHDGEARARVDEALAAGADMIELRIDQFADKTTAHVLAEVKQFSGVPRIGTIRSAVEGGGWSGTEEERLGLYESILPEVEAVDIELGAEKINHQVISLAAKQGVTVIASFHDFEKTPTSSFCASLIRQGMDLGADIVKIAAHCESREDFHRLTAVLLEHPDRNLVVIGMGARGIQSRFLFPALGSLITYTFLGVPTAPGQVSLEETLRLIRVLYP